MAPYRIQEAEFTLPAALYDKSVCIFSSADSGKAEFNIVVSRDKLKPGVDLPAYVEQQIKEMGEKFPGFRLHGQAEVTVGTAPAMKIDYQWKSEQTLLFQRQHVLIVRPPEGAPAYALMITATSPKGLDTWEATLAEFLTGIRLRW